jgi:GST-like protein
MATRIIGESSVAKYPNFKRLLDEVSARPAAARASVLKDKFTFKTENDEDALGFLYRHMKTKVA